MIRVVRIQVLIRTTTFSPVLNSVVFIRYCSDCYYTIFLIWSAAWYYRAEGRININGSRKLICRQGLEFHSNIYVLNYRDNIIVNLV
ncbi:hypothetical protein ES703_31156 [subsurface metagenome]